MFVGIYFSGIHLFVFSVFNSNLHNDEITYSCFHEQYINLEKPSYIKDVFSSLGSITTGDSEATCATSLLSSYNSVTITDSTGSTTCSSTEMDGCADRTEMRYTYDASCGSTLKFSSQFNCKFDLRSISLYQLYFFSALLSLFISNYL